MLAGRRRPCTPPPSRTDVDSDPKPRCRFFTALCRFATRAAARTSAPIVAGSSFRLPAALPPRRPTSATDPRCSPTLAADEARRPGDLPSRRLMLAIDPCCCRRRRRASSDVPAAHQSAAPPIEEGAAKAADVEARRGGRPAADCCWSAAHCAAPLTSTAARCC